MRTTAANSAVPSALLGALLWLSAAAISSTTASAQSPPPALYLGAGTGTNLGGTVGFGVELPVHRAITVSTAIGVWPESLASAELANRALDYDLGLKVYPFGRFLYGGVNYGLVHGEILTAEPGGSRQMRKRHAFTFSVGGRKSLLGPSYGSLFLGVTSDGHANHMRALDRRTFVPHFGLLIGLELSPRH